MASDYKNAHIYLMRGTYRAPGQGLFGYSQPSLDADECEFFPGKQLIGYTGKVRANSVGWLIVNNNQRKTYVPFATLIGRWIVRNGHEVGVKNRTLHLREPWEYDQAPMHGVNTSDLELSAIEEAALEQLSNKVKNVADTDAVVIGCVTDVHYDSHRSATTKAMLHELQAMSSYAQRHHVDALVSNGDLVDGIQTLDRTLLDTKAAVETLRASEVPCLFVQGNHDDNSGFARFVNGDRVEQVISAETLASLRGLDRLTDGSLSPSVLYGMYHFSGTKVYAILLDAFDMPDSSAGGYFTDGYDDVANTIHWNGVVANIRHSRSRFQRQQAEWLETTLDALPADAQVIVFSHAAIRRPENQKAPGFYWTYDWFVNNQQGYYARIYHALLAHQGQIIAIVTGHNHVDDWANDDGLNWIASTSAISSRRKSDANQSNCNINGAWDVLVINPSQREMFRLRYGWQDLPGSKRGSHQHLVKRCTNHIKMTFEKYCNLFRNKSVVDELDNYNNITKHVVQRWNGFRGHFNY